MISKMESSVISNSSTNPAVTSKMYLASFLPELFPVHVTVSKADLHGGTFLSI